MTVLSNRVHEHRKPWVSVNLYGDHPQMVHDHSVLMDSIDTAVDMGADRKKVCALVPAAGQTSPHFQKLLPANSTTCIEDRLWADAAWTMDPDATIILPTADCQAIVIKNLVTGMLVVAHGGKPAMAPGHICENDRWNIVDRCINKAIENADPGNLQIFVTGVISGENYWHQDSDGQVSMEPFRRVYGTDVFFGDPSNGRLDLYSTTQAVASRWKVPISQVSSDGLDTFVDPGLASYRANGSSNRNITIAVNRPVER